VIDLGLDNPMDGIFRDFHSRLKLRANEVKKKRVSFFFCLRVVASLSPSPLVPVDADVRDGGGSQKSR
jgi:hypothetical protein